MKHAVYEQSIVPMFIFLHSSKFLYEAAQCRLALGLDSHNPIKLVPYDCTIKGTAVKALSIHGIIALMTCCHACRPDRPAIEASKSRVPWAIAMQRGH